MSDKPNPDPVLVPIPAPDQPGVLRADVDAVHHALTIDFDPRLISDEGVRKALDSLLSVDMAEKIAKSAAPLLQEQDT